MRVARHQTNSARASFRSAPAGQDHCGSADFGVGLTYWAVGRQNVYDDPSFFAGYRKMRANRAGLHENVVHPALPLLLEGDLLGSRILDLGCGDGWFCKIALEGGAEAVVGIDPSYRMLADARASITDSRASFVQGFVEDAEFEASSFDLIASIFALHYVEDFVGVTRSIARWLVPGGVLAVVVEHPVMTCQHELDWVRDDGGEPIAWPVCNYHDEGGRVEHWFIDGVVKYHRRIETIVNALREAHFTIERLIEPAPAPEIVEFGRGRSSLIRPEVLGIRARKATIGRSVGASFANAAHASGLPQGRATTFMHRVGG